MVPIPATIGIANILALDKYGKFIAITPPGFTISADDAVSITAEDTAGWLEPYHKNLNKCVILEIPVPWGWGAIVERFNWGESSRPSKIFFEVYRIPGVLYEHVPEVKEKLKFPTELEYFHSCGVITNANVDNRAAHPAAALKVNFYIWNRTASPDVPLDDVWVELAVWCYLFRLEHYNTILRMSSGSRAFLTEEILEEVRRPREEVRVPWEEILEEVRGLREEVRELREELVEERPPVRKPPVIPGYPCEPD